MFCTWSERVASVTCKKRDARKEHQWRNRLVFQPPKKIEQEFTTIPGGGPWISPQKKTDKKQMCSNIVMLPKCLERVCSVWSVSSLRHEWWLSSRKSITFDQILGYLLLRQTNKKPNTWLPHPTSLHSLHPRRPPIHRLPLARRDVPRRVDGWIPNIGWP